MKKSLLILALVLSPFMVFGQSVAIAAGSSSAVGSFQADQYYSGGSTYNNTNTIDVSLITSNPPPAALFNNERYGAMSYTIPGFTAGSSCTVTLYFAETYLTASGGRVFNVSINGTSVLTNFDVYASAGAQNKAIAKSFATTADSSGQIVIQFTSVTENPKINGISVQSGGSSSCSTLGDPNTSGSIDIVDALIIAQAYVGLNPSNFNAACADVNCSGSVDVVDALIIAQYYVGIISSFPCTITTTTSSSTTTTTTSTASTTSTTTTTSNASTTTTTSSGGSSCNGSSGNVYLCFDDAPSNGNSPTLVNNLKNAGACKATFFVIGSYVSGNQTGWNAIKSAGFSIQNHTQTHQHMTSWTYQQVYNDMQQCNQTIVNGGAPTPNHIRLPYLESNSTIQQACSALGLTIVNVSIDSQDWNGASTSAIISAVSGLSSGQNALQHDFSANTVSAIPTIVSNLKAKGLGFTQF